MINTIKQQREIMQRKKYSLFKKAYKLGKLCDADVAIIVCKNGCLYIYKSINQKAWPLSIEQIVSSIPFFIFNIKILIKISNYVSTTENFTFKIEYLKAQIIKSCIKRNKKNKNKSLEFKVSRDN